MICEFLSGQHATLRKTDSVTDGAFFNATYVLNRDSDDVTPRPVPDEQRLMTHILRGYEKAVRPVQNASSIVVVKMGLTLTQIFDMVSRDSRWLMVLKLMQQTLCFLDTLKCLIHCHFRCSPLCV